MVGALSVTVPTVVVHDCDPSTMPSSAPAEKVGSATVWELPSGKATTTVRIVAKMPTVITTEAKPQGPEIEIRMPMGTRLLQLCVFLVGTFVAAVVTVALAGRATPWAALAGLALAVWIGYFYRLLHIAVIVRGEEIQVRNLFTTHRVERSQIGDVGLGESAVARAPNRTVVLGLLDGRHLALDACARQLQSGRRPRKVEDFRTRLTAWSGHRESERDGESHLQRAAGRVSSSSEAS